MIKDTSREAAETERDVSDDEHVHYHGKGATIDEALADAGLIPPPQQDRGQRALTGLIQAISVLENYGDHHEWCDRSDGSAEACSCGLWNELEKLNALRAALATDGAETP